MYFLQAINSDLSVLIVCNKLGGTITGDIKKKNCFYLLINMANFPEGWDLFLYFTYFFLV